MFCQSISENWLVLFSCLLLFLKVTATTTTNYNYHYFYNGDETSSFVFIDERLPKQSSSPGWLQNPKDIETTVGSYVYFTCQNKYSNNRTVWLLDGREDIFFTKYSPRVKSQNNGKTIRFGPVRREDNGVGINCEVWTNFGVLPSPLGTIYVLTKPSYSPSPKSVFIGQPCYYDFGFTGSKPNYVRWYKNGERFFGQHGRVTIDHKGITFTKVLQRDSGMYEVQARNKAGAGKGSGYLRIVFWWKNGTNFQHAGLQKPDIPINVAVAIALTQNKTNNATKKYQHVRVSSVDSTAFAMKVLRKLNNRANNNAKKQGRSRELVEYVLHQLVSIIGHPLTNLNESEMSQILNATGCDVLSEKYNCLDYRVLRYRTINGTCNNLFFPLNGAANMAFARMLPAHYEDKISQPNGYKQARLGNPFSGPWPSPRFISWHLVNDLDHSSDKMSHMFMSWGQFLDHDLDLAPVFDDEDGEDLECDCNFTSKCLPILVHPKDPVFGEKSSHMGECLPLTRSIPVCRCRDGHEISRNQINQLTSYIDASQVYGSDDEQAQKLRLCSGGLLKTGGKSSTNKGNLPFQDKMAPRGNIPLFDAGDMRSNEQVGLTVMHTIWLREHNRIAKNFAKLNPCWGDEKIYQETRKIIGAMMQVITYEEFLPTLFGQYYEDYVPPYYGYNPFVDATIPNEFAAAAFRFGHSLVRPVLLRLNEDFKPVKEGPLPLERAFFNPIEYFKSNGTDPLLRGLLVAQSRDVDEFVNSVLTSKLFTESPEKLGTDLASLNIQRGRDHGLAPYREWQKLCENVFPRRNATFRYSSTERKMREIYGQEGFNKGMDLWVGGLSERKLPGAQVGPTFACILGLTFTRIRDGDRFWYESPYTFRSSQLRQLRKVTLAKVICNNADNITEVQPSAFRGDQKRISCNEIKDINLSYWRDYRCHNYRYSRRRYGRSIDL